MSLIETMADNIKADIEKYGFFFWIILFGVIILIIAIPNGFGKEYNPMAILFMFFGFIGYCFSEIRDRISTTKYDKKPSLKFQKTTVIIKFIILFLLLASISFRYHYFF